MARAAQVAPLLIADGGALRRLARSPGSYETAGPPKRQRPTSHDHTIGYVCPRAELGGGQRWQHQGLQVALLSARSSAPRPAAYPSALLRFASNWW